MDEPHVVRIAVPNPFFVEANNVYVIASRPLTLIDTGVATARAFHVFEERLAEHGWSVEQLERVILTHKHIDHIGNAWRVQQRSGAEIWIGRCEVQAVTQVDPAGRRYAQLAAQRAAQWRVPGELAAPAGGSRRRWEIEPARARPLDHGQTLPLEHGEIQVIHTPGHTMGSICLKLGHVLFTGDHVLPRISPNVGGGDMRQHGLLERYLASLKIVQEAAGDVSEVLPGHGEPFADLAGRCRELERLHQQRLDAAVEILRRQPEATVYEVARELFGQMLGIHVLLGCAEAAAHLELLQQQGRVVSRDGRYRLA